VRSITERALNRALPSGAMKKRRFWVASYEIVPRFPGIPKSPDFDLWRLDRVRYG
jgi:hypothetical protein